MHTVVITESERERRFTNEINKAVRRCVIGKVKRKLPPLSDDLRNAFRGALWPHLDTPLPKQTYAGGVRAHHQFRRRSACARARRNALTP